VRNELDRDQDGLQAGMPWTGSFGPALSQSLKEEGMLAMIERGADLRRARVVVVWMVVTVVAGAFAFAGAAPAAAKGTVWLCLPGHHPDPCTPGLSTTVYSPKLEKLRVTHPKRVKHPTIDCFYVYPTVSDQKTPVANLHIDPTQMSIALYQVARYSQYCRVFAPMYRQATLAGISTPGTTANPPTPAQAAEGPADVAAAFKTYLKKYNHGRGFVLIGHSQGSFVLRGMIAKLVDPKPSVRTRLVSAILMGGNVLVKNGSDVGGDFRHVPACHSVIQLGCVIAFSTFDAPPPPDSYFGRTSGRLGTANKGVHVLCTNPAALGGGSGKLDPVFPSKPFAPGSTIATGNKLLMITQPMPRTVWGSIPGAYGGRCSSAGGANVLQIRPLDGAQTPHPAPTPEWGLHLLDGQVALGNLVKVVKSEAAAFALSTAVPVTGRASGR
jgi:Protein of unknown function (DUF3089)